MREGKKPVLSRLSLPGDRHRAVLAALAVLWTAGCGFAQARMIDSGKGAAIPAHPDCRPGQVLVRFKPGRASAGLAALEKRLGLKAVSSRRLYGCDWILVDTDTPTGTRGLVMAFREDADVVAAEPNYHIRLSNAPVQPDDTQFGSQWGWHNTGQNGGTADADIDAPEAWAHVTSSDVVVAVIDTGVDYTHPDLTANMWTNPGETPGNGVDDDGNGFVDDVYGVDFVNSDSDPMDDDGHGTHVAGTIGAVGNNGAGVTGVCWTAKIMAIKFLDADGKGTIAGAVSGINYARDHGARVLNNSWGGEGDPPQVLTEAIASLTDALFVAAAGNEGNDNDRVVSTPSNDAGSHVIAVAATTRNDALASFSNYGAATVDLGAPGESILSTTLNDGYGWLSGTSMATPAVSGACALVWAAAGGVSQTSALEVRDAVLRGVDVIGALQDRCATGGRLNLKNAVDFIAGGRYLRLTAETTGKGFEQGAAVPVTWTHYGAGWQAGDQVVVDVSSDSGGTWSVAPGGSAVAAAQQSFALDTTGLNPAGTYRLRIAYTGDATVSAASAADFAITGGLAAFDVAIAPQQVNQSQLKGDCLVTARDSAGRRISTFGAHNTAGRFPVTVTAPGVSITGLSGTGADLDAPDFVAGVADLAALGAVVAVPDSTPVTVQFSVASASDATGVSGSVKIHQVSPYLTEHFEHTAMDLNGRRLLFVPEQNDARYAVFIETISGPPVDPAGGTSLSLQDDDYAYVSVADGRSVRLFGRRHTAFYVGSNGYITFDGGDTTYSESLEKHFERPRISALFTDLLPLASEVSTKQLSDRIAVTWWQIREYSADNASSFQVELFFNGTIALSLVDVAAANGIVGLSDGTGTPADFIGSDLSNVPLLPGRLLYVATPAPRDTFHVGDGVGVEWQRLGTAWSGTEQLSLEFSADAGMNWAAIPGTAGLQADAELGTFEWDTSGLQPTDLGLLRVSAAADPTVTDVSNGEFQLLPAGQNLPTPDFNTQFFDTEVFDLPYKCLTFTPLNVGRQLVYVRDVRDIAEFPTSTDHASLVRLMDDDSVPITLPAGKSFPFFGVHYTTLHLNSNGNVTFDSPSYTYDPSPAEHFAQPRISPLFVDLRPRRRGIYHSTETDRVVISFINVWDFYSTRVSTFQLELFFDGRIVMSYLHVDDAGILTGLSDGNGVPGDYVESDLSALSATDLDADGLVDAWEVRYFGDLSADPDDDSDLDGATNRAESDADTDPLDGWQLAITVTNAGVSELRIGMTRDATNEADAGLDVPLSVPRDTANDVFLQIGAEAFSTDLRAFEQPAEWSLRVGADPGAAASRLSWDPAAIPPGKFLTLIATTEAGDPIGQAVDMNHTSALVLEQGEDVRARILFDDESVRIMRLEAGWNLVSFAVQPLQDAVGDVFGGRQIGDVWAWRGGAYASVASVNTKEGFWVYVAGPATFQVTGLPEPDSIRSLDAGWHLLGPVRARPAPDLPFLEQPVFGWRGGRYIVAAQLEEMFGYWLRATGAGQVDLGD